MRPSTYTVRDPGESEWTTYKGHNHAPLAATPLAGAGDREGGGEPAWRELAVDGDRFLLGTRHGVVLTDTRRSRHAWIYVFAGGHKLRWPSVVGARFDGDRSGAGHAIVEVELRDGLPERRELRIDLATGEVEGSADP